MPDDDWALGQNEIDVRNEEHRERMSGTQGKLFTDPWPDPIGWYIQIGEHEWEDHDENGNVVARHTTSRPRRTKATGA